MISAGELREIIAIQKPERTPNGSGGYDTVYIDVIPKTYAKVVEKRSNSDLVADQDNIKNYVHFRIRYRPLNFLKLGYRVIWRGFVFTINNIKVDPLRTEINIFASIEIETSER